MQFADGLTRVQESYHMELLQVENGFKPTRDERADSRICNDTIEKAWDRLGDLSKKSFAERGYLISNFLTSLRLVTGSFIKDVSNGKLFNRY